MRLKSNFRDSLVDLSQAIDYILSMDEFGSVEDCAPFFSLIRSSIDSLLSRPLRSLLKS